MPRASIDYMNARRELRKGSDHSSKRAVEYAPDSQADGFDIARNAIGAFSLWAETTRQVYAARLGLMQTEPETEIPF